MNLTDYFRKIFILSENFKSIEGFLSELEGIILYTYALSNIPGEIVEIGSFKGKSTSWLAQGVLDSKKKIKVNAIDPHTGSNEHKNGGKYSTNFNGSTFNDFTNNLTRYGLTKFVNPIKQTSMNAVKEWRGKIGLLFIDGSHKYDDVRNDFIKWSKFVPIGGIIILHDTIKWEGPKAVVEELIEGDKNFKSFKLHSMTVAEKVKGGQK